MRLFKRKASILSPSATTSASAGVKAKLHVRISARAAERLDQLVAVGASGPSVSERLNRAAHRHVGDQFYGSPPLPIELDDGGSSAPKKSLAILAGARISCARRLILSYLRRDFNLAPRSVT